MVWSSREPLDERALATDDGSPERLVVSEDTMVWSPHESPDERAALMEEDEDTEVRVREQCLIIGEKEYAIRDVERIWVAPIRRSPHKGAIVGTSAAVAGLLMLAAFDVATWVSVGASLLVVAAMAIATATAIRSRLKVQHGLWLSHRGQDVLVIKTSRTDK